MSDVIDRLNAALEGRYRIDRELGEGGMATVYLAEDLRHDRKVALKVLKPELAAVVGGDRFLAEIKTTANLQHPHILPLFDSGEADRFLFYVMPYVEGESLREKLDREKQLPVEEAVSLAVAVAAALQHAHDRGVIHRDIKPANILLQDGQPVVADFGIALAVGAAGGARLTETGLSVGTPYYMSPEQATGDQSVGPATDLYALGCVLYEMLTGEAPYGGNTAQAVLGKIIAGSFTPAREVRSTVPAHVDGAIRKALEKLPADRFASVGEFAAALEDPSFRLDTQERKTVDGVNPVLVWALAAALVLVAGIAAWAVTSRPEIPVVRVALGLPADQRPVYGGINLTPPRVALTPDGAAIVYVGPGPATAAEVLPGGGRAFPGGQFALGVASQLWRQPLRELDSRPIPGTEGAWAPEVSPDGRLVAFSVFGESRTSIKVAPLDGGPPLTVATSGDLASPSWGPDDRVYFVGASGHRILRVSATGGPVDTVTVLPEFETGARILWLDVLPDGRGAVATIGVQTQGRLSTHEIHAIDLEAGESERIAAGVYGIYADWGYLLFVTQDNVLMAAPFDPGSRRVTGQPTALIEGVDYRNNGASDVAVSGNGSLVYSTAGLNAPEVLMWVDRQGRVAPVDSTWTGALEFESLALSPDGRRLAVEMVNIVRGRDPSPQRGDVWIKQLPAGPLSRLTFEGEDNRVPTWTPDGSRITYLSRNEKGRWQLLQRLADGSGSPQALPVPEGELHEVVWSPDGEWLLGSAAGESSDDIVALQVGSDTAWHDLVAGPANQFEPAVSPSGQWLAYVSEESGRAEIYIRPFPETTSGKWQVSTGGGIEPVWGSSDQELYYRSFDGTVVWRARLDNGPSAAVRDVVFRIPVGAYEANPRNRLIALAADGRRFLMINQTGQGDVSGDLVFVQNMLAELREKAAN